MSVQRKIKTVAEIGALLAKRGHKKVVLCHGEFDLLHFGHTRYFKAARKFGDLLVVTLTPDRFIAKGPGRPVFNQDQRAEAIANLEFVDYVAINEWPTALETLESIRPDVYVKGSEYLNKVDVTGRLEAEKKKVESLGGKMEFTHEIIFSSSKLLNNHFEVFSKEARPFLSKLSESTKAETLLDSLRGLEKLKVLVLGEFGLEQVHLVAPGQPALVEESSPAPQGALLGLNLLKSFCEQLDFLSIGGTNQTPVSPWMPPQVFADLIVDDRWVYPSGERFVDKSGFCRFEATFQKPAPLSAEEEKKILGRLERKLSGYDLVLVFDLGLGFVTPKIKEKLARRASHLSLFLGVQRPGAVHQALADYRKLDLLVSPGPLFADGAAAWALTEPIWRDQPDLLLATEGGGLLRQSQLGKIPLAPLVSSATGRPGVDWPSAVFALTACLDKLGLPEDWVLLLGGATASLSLNPPAGPWSFDKMLFDKFVIALLNR